MEHPPQFQRGFPKKFNHEGTQRKFKGVLKTLNFHADRLEKKFVALFS